MLIDRYNRTHDYLRISVTDRCNLRCTYCMPAEGIAWKPAETLLTNNEILRLAGIMAGMGIKKIRLTGGEPTVRSDLPELVSTLAQIAGIENVSLTTNGVIFSKHAHALKEAGLKGVNISLDTLDSAKFIQITRRDALSRVLHSLNTALECGFEQVKLNMVVMAGINEDELPDFVEIARTRPINVRFIEYMPFKGNRWDPSGVVSFSDMRARLESAYDLRALPETFVSNRVAEDFIIPGFLGKVSFISSMSNSFCERCTRLRLTADGALKACLFFPAQVHLRDSLRANVSEESLKRLITDAVLAKPKGHPSPSELEELNDLSMIEIGG